jgi:hypothetical protein
LKRKKKKKKEMFKSLPFAFFFGFEHTFPVTMMQLLDTVGICHRSEPAL